MSGSSHPTRGVGCSQGLGCSPIKAVRELGLERRETVRSLAAVWKLEKGCPSTERTGMDEPLVCQLSCQGAPLISYVRK